MKLFSLFINNAEKQIKLGDEYYKKRKFNEAIKAYRKALEYEPNNQIAQNKIRILYREKDALEAVFALAKEPQTKTILPQEIIIPRTQEPTQERRKFIRTQDKRHVHYRLIKKMEMQDVGGDAFNKDISAGGIYIFSEKEIPKDTFLELVFEMPPPQEPIFAIGRIVRIEEILEEGKRYFGLGIRFTNISGKDQQRIEEHIFGKTEV